jgi:hypothetical protein
VNIHAIATVAAVHLPQPLVDLSIKVVIVLWSLPWSEFDELHEKLPLGEHQRQPSHFLQNSTPEFPVPFPSQLLMVFEMPKIQLFVEFLFQTDITSSNSSTLRNL